MEVSSTHRHADGAARLPSALERAWGPNRRRRRRALKLVADASSMAIATVSMTMLRYDLHPPGRMWPRIVAFSLVSGLVVACIASALGLYRERWAYGSFDELMALFRLSVLVAGVLIALDLLLRHQVPLTVAMGAPFVSLVLMGGIRCLWRLVHERSMRPNDQLATRVLVFGAGEGARQIVTAMLRSPSGRFLPVALLDDDPQKRHMRIKNVAVEGAREQLLEVAKRHDAEVVLLAVPSAGAGLVRDLQELVDQAGLRLFVLPSVSELYGAKVSVNLIRPVTHADLLGRHEVDTDVDSIAGYVTGRRVLVTGAGGSIGSELCRQIYRFAPAQLVMLDRDESALHGVQLSLEGRAMLDDRNLVVCDIRDRDRLAQVFSEHEPEVVFHAAALKHLPLLEMHPVEAIKTNLWGTANLLELAARQGVVRFVNISTDKAADPCSVLGYTKRIAERFTAHAATSDAGVFLSVRFGNVLGSRGSVLTTFRAQIEAGGPVTVTDPEVTRYFMTVEEAVQLVIQAGALGRAGEALVLDMGEPVRIAEVAQRLIEENERAIEMVYTGLRPGEKLKEVLFGTGEVDERPCHPRIAHVAVPPLDPMITDAIGMFDSTEAIIKQLKDIAAEPAPGTQPSVPLAASATEERV
ncbi:MAG: putative polysaccharide biosynthesis protein [Acidimicrobiales bacterium]|nr:putative polysaccharide biosynthesis protein [Acidimicrobiales bacterium]